MDISSPILHVITRLEAGGAPRSLLLLLEGLARKDVPVELVTGLTPPPAKDMLPEARALGIPIHVIPSLKRDPNPWHDLTSLFRLWRLFIRLRPILVHAHTSKAGFLARIAALVAGVQVRVYSPRGTILEGYFKGQKRWFFTWLERISAKWTHAIIGLTSEESESYLAAGIGRPEQHLHISIGIDSDAYSPPDKKTRLRMRREESIADEEVLLISTGRLVPVKDHASLIQGLSLLKDLDTPWKCWILGSGPEEERLKVLVRELALENHVRLWGQIKNTAELLGLGDIFVLTSINEGFGRVLLEAMSARLAIVATAVGGVPSVLDGGTAGHLIPPRNPRELAEALELFVLSPAERETYAAAAHKRVSTTYNLETTVQQHINLYESLLIN